MEQPFPDSTLTKEEMTALKGTWQLEDTVVYVDFTTNGLPVMSSVEWADGRHRLIHHDLHIVSREGSYFLSVLADPPDESKGHFFAPFRMRNREIVVWAPDVEFFENRIKDDKLKGRVKKDGDSTEIMLTAPPSQILDLIATNWAATDYEEPLIFKKLD